jgi:enoyl-CoA hydratase/carnithine racemase
VVDIAQALAKKPALALQQTKALLKQDSSAVAQHIDDELKIFVEAMQSDAANEAFTAFVEKRSINYDKFK